MILDHLLLNLMSLLRSNKYWFVFRKVSLLVLVLLLLLKAYGAPELDDSLEGDALIEAILEQKQKEFAGEGVRIFDLKRLGRPLKRMTNFGAGVSSTVSADDYRWLFPIPQSEYKYNDKITQNNPQWPFIKAD